MEASLPKPGGVVFLKTGGVEREAGSEELETLEPISREIRGAAHTIELETIQAGA